MERKMQTHGGLGCRSLLGVALVALLVAVPGAAPAQDDAYTYTYPDTANPMKLYWQNTRFMMEGLASLEKAANCLNEHFEDDQVHEFVQEIHDYADSLRNGVEAHEAGSLSFARSRTLEEGAKYLLGKMPDVVTALKATGKISSDFMLPAPSAMADLATATGRIIGSGGRFDIETTTYCLDSLAKGAWWTVGYLKGGPALAGAYESLAGATLELGREATYPLFERGWKAATGAARDKIDAWEGIKTRSLASGLPVPAISEMFGGRDYLLKNGFSGAMIDRYDTEALNLNNRFSAMRADFSPATFTDLSRTGTFDVGGVTIDPDLVSLGEGGAKLKTQTMDARPSEDDLSWPVDLPDEEDD
ncbi:MAG: hypothetical protein ABIE42_00870 [Candidatus Eisenbacteria bacterium]